MSSSIEAWGEQKIKDKTLWISVPRELDHHSAERICREADTLVRQKDIREIQLAKAAIAAGIRILMKKLFITEEDIACLYIAGAFGNYMNPVSAGTIGLFPISLIMAPSWS